MSEYIPLVSWETKLIDVQVVLARPFHYTCKVDSVNPNDYAPNELGDAGTLLVPKTDRFYIVDYTGKIYQIKYIVDVPNKIIQIYDLIEDADEGPYITESAFVYQSRGISNALTQAQRKRLHPSAIDQIWNIENNILSRSISDHSVLLNRDAAGSHPASAISYLNEDTTLSNVQVEINKLIKGKVNNFTYFV